MTIKLIAIKADQLLEALPNARTVSTLCLHICQWMLEYHMAHLRHDHRDRKTMENQLSSIQWYFNMMLALADDSISATPSMDVLSITFMKKIEVNRKMSIAYTMFDLSMEGYQDTPSDVVLSFLALLIKEGIDAIKRCAAQTPENIAYADNCSTKLIELLGATPLLSRNIKHSALLRLRITQ